MWRETDDEVLAKKNSSTNIIPIVGSIVGSFALTLFIVLAYVHMWLENIEGY